MKKAVALCTLLAMMLSLCFGGGVLAATEVLFGDVDGNQRIDASDALLTLQHSVQLRTLSEDELERADVDDDGKANAADALLILQRSVGLPVVFLADAMEAGEQFPYFSRGTSLGTFSRNLNNTEYVYAASKEDYLSYRALLETMGYTLYQQNSIAGNWFATYQSPSGLLHTYYVPSSRTVRIVEDVTSPWGWMESTSQGEFCDITLAQLTPDYRSGWGNMYVLTLEDGRFVIFDGGMDAIGTDHDTLYHYLQMKNIRPDGIVIAAWILTHEDADHYGGIRGFARAHSDKVTLEQFWLNPSPYSGFIDPLLSEMLELHSDPEVVVLHTGQKFSRGGVDFEVLYTGDDWYPKPGVSSNENNDASLVLRLTVDGQRVLMTGDIMELASDIVCDMYGRELKSEIVQASHHGCEDGTVTEEFYDLVDPRVMLWPCSSGNFVGWWDYDVNYHILFERNVQESLIADVTVKELPLPYRGLESLKQWDIDPKGTITEITEEYNEILGFIYTMVYTPDRLPPE